MELITALSNGLDKLLIVNAALISGPSNYDTINIKTVESREVFMSVLAAMSNALADVGARIDEALEKARDAHTKELSIIPPLIDKLNKSDAIGWKIVGKKHRFQKGEPTNITYSSKVTASLPDPISPPKHLAPARSDSKEHVPVPPLLHPSQSKYTVVKITEALYLNAIRVPTFNYVRQDGELYYVATVDHFAVKIAGLLLHGNIGNIYTDERNPEKIKECKFAESCVKRDRCDYYHDPLKYGGSRDRRNFIASSWLYTSATAVASACKNTHKSRRFGSRANLDIDIVSLSEDEISRFRDQTAHDLLCSLLLNQAFQPST